MLSEWRVAASAPASIYNCSRVFLSLATLPLFDLNSPHIFLCFVLKLDRFISSSFSMPPLSDSTSSLARDRTRRQNIAVPARARQEGIFLVQRYLLLLTRLQLTRVVRIAQITKTQRLNALPGPRLRRDQLLRTTTTISFLALQCPSPLQRPVSLLYIFLLTRSNYSSRGNIRENRSYGFGCVVLPS